MVETLFLFNDCVCLFALIWDQHKEKLGLNLKKINPTNLNKSKNFGIIPTSVGNMINIYGIRSDFVKVPIFSAIQNPKYLFCQKRIFWHASHIRIIFNVFRLLRILSVIFWAEFDPTNCKCRSAISSSSVHADGSNLTLCLCIFVLLLQTFFGFGKRNRAPEDKKQGIILEVGKKQ